MNTTYDNGLTWVRPPSKWFGCVDARQSGEDVTDDPPSSGTTSTLFEAYNWGSDTNNCWAYKISGSGHNQTKTCTSTGSGLTYLSPLDETTQGPNYLCPQQVTSMTNNANTLTTAINAMTAQGDTAIPQGSRMGLEHALAALAGAMGRDDVLERIAARLRHARYE